uniref:Uncharacterized protein n=1 Tax=Anopheles funestus TaxID=62324 RepID=A0A182S1R0_ANOFN
MYSVVTKSLQTSRDSGMVANDPDQSCFSTVSNLAEHPHWQRRSAAAGVFAGALFAGVTLFALSLFAGFGFASSTTLFFSDLFVASSGQSMVSLLHLCRF